MASKLTESSEEFLKTFPKIKDQIDGTEYLETELREMLEWKDHRERGRVFHFVARFINRATVLERTASMTLMRTQNSEIVAVVMKFMTQRS